MTKPKIGVLRGGPSSEYEVSIKSGQTVLSRLPESFHPVDILIDRKGVWHMEGLPKSPEEILRQLDVVVNALHGQYGEDGKVQEILEDFQIPFTGSGRLSSALAMNKLLTKQTLKKRLPNEGFVFKTPHYRKVNIEESGPNLAREIFSTFPMPVIIKPVSLGSSVGVELADTLSGLETSLTKVFQVSEDVLIEEFIHGKEATCGVIDNFRGQKTYSLMPVEIKISSKSGLFDYDSKYSDKLHELACPGNFSREESDTLQEIARFAHETLGLRHYSRSDFIVHPRRGVYFLEVNTLPGLTKESLLPKSLDAVGVSVSEFLEHIINEATVRR
ncbi:MAG: D-alanine--D-alanine ligase [bacterium]|nr:D-alanine--D-alanine ligase [bacterium]